MLRAGASVDGVDDLRLRRSEAIQEIGFFIVNVRYVLRTEKTLLFAFGAHLER